MPARRDLLQALSLGLASLLLPVSRGNAAETRVQRMKSSIRFQNKASSTGWMSFDMPNDRYIVLSAMLNTEPVQVLLDSAVGSTVLDMPLAAKLKLRPKGAFIGRGATGFATGTTTEGVTISIGNIVLTTPEATVFDLSPFSVATNYPIVAVLGYDVFGSLLVDIDFEGRKIAFRDPNVPAIVNGAKLEPLVEGKFGKRELSISIEGRPPIPAIFDLGSDTPLYISPDYLERQQLFRGKKTSTSLSVGVEGVEENLVAVIERIEIGGASLQNIPVEVPHKWAQDVSAVVGVPILSRFRLMTNFGRDLIWMRANQDVIVQPFRKDRLGMAASPAGDCMRVVHIAPRSPAESAGLKVGDEIVAVNGQVVDAKYLKSRPREGTKPAGTILHLRLRNGSNLALTLADYF